MVSKKEPHWLFFYLNMVAKIVKILFYIIE